MNRNMKLGATAVAALFVLVFFFGSGLQSTGQLGDSIGGLANVGTLVVAAYVAWKALPQQLKLIRDEAHLNAEIAHRTQLMAIHSAAASNVWDAAASLGTHLRGMIDPVLTHPTIGETDAFRRAELAPAANRFLDALARAELFFDQSTYDRLHALWLTRAWLLGAIPAQRRGGDPVLYEQLYGGEAGRRIESDLAAIRTALRPYAVPGAAPLATSPALQALPPSQG